MSAELNILKLTPAPEARPAKPAPNASSREREEGEGFSSVLQRVSGEAGEKPQAKAAQDDSNRNPENGLAAGKDENLAGEEGSSRSASLSPNEPDQVEESETLVTDPLETSEAAQVLISNAGGELPFLVPLPEFVAQSAQEIAAAQGENLDALTAKRAFEAVAETAIPVASQFVLETAQAPEAVQVAPQTELEQALAALEPVSEEEISTIAFELPKPVREAKTEAAPVQEKAPQLVLDRPIASDAQESEPEFDAQNDNARQQSLRDQVSQGRQESAEKKSADPGSVKPLERREASTVAAPAQEDIKPEVDLFQELQAAVEKSVRKSGSEIAPQQVVAEDAAKSASSNDFSQFLREFQGVERTREANASQGAAPAETHRPLPGSLEDQVFRQIRMKLEPGLSQVDIKLLPPELGSVRIRFELEGDRMKAHIEAKEAATAALLERHLPELKSTMTQAGLQVKEFEITTSNAFLGLSLQNGNMNEAQNEARENSRRFSGAREREAEGRDGEESSGELVVSRSDGGIDYVI